MRLYKKLLIVSIMLFCAFTHNVKAVYNSNSGTAYNGSVGSCGNTKNCKNNSSYFITQVRLYYINNGSFTQIGSTYYFVNASAYNYLNGKVPNIIYISDFNNYSNNAAGHSSAYNYIKNIYLANADNRKTLLNGITNTENYDDFLNKDMTSSKSYRLVIEPAENYANPTFTESTSSENAAIYTVKGLATEMMRINAAGSVANDVSKTNANNSELILGVKQKVQWLYNDSNDVGVTAQSKNKCEDLTIERISDIKTACGYKMIKLDSYISTKACYIQNGVNTQNGGLKCLKYDENNTEQYSPKYVETSCNGVSESTKLSILKNYGKLVAGSNSCGIYCKEVADVSYPGNVLTPVQTGSYFAWPSRYDDVTGKYKMNIKTKLVCYTVGTQTSKMASTFERKCPTGYTEWSGTINGVYYDICRENNYSDPICPSGYVNYTYQGQEICRATAESARICPEGYSTPVANTNYCRNNTTVNKVCPSGYVNRYGDTCYKACASGYVFKNGQCRKPRSLECPSGQYKDGSGKCHTKKDKICPSGYSLVNGRCRKLVKINYSCPSGTTNQSGSGASLQCKKFTGYSCDSGWQMETNYNHNDCCKGSYCYTPGYCTDGYNSTKVQGTICWKYRGNSTSYGHCNAGYWIWGSQNNTCWACDEPGGYEAWGKDGAGNWFRVYHDPKNTWSCGYYTTTSGTSHCPQNYTKSGNSCVRKITKPGTATSCGSGWTFKQEPNHSSGSVYSGLGTCEKYEYASMQTTSGSSVWIESGWLQSGDVHWEWEWKAAKSNYQTLTRIETPVYDYKDRICDNGYTSLNATQCYSNTSSNPSVCNGELIDGICYEKNDKSTPANTAAICPSGSHMVNNTCYKSSAKVCDSSTTVEIGGKCYKKATRVCDYNTTPHKATDYIVGNELTPIKKDYHDKECPASHPTERNGLCYKIVDGSAGVKVTKEYTTTRICSSGYEETPGGSGATACRKANSCSSGWSKETGDSTTYCCNSSNGYCYSTSYASCSGSYVPTVLNSYCWKYGSNPCDGGYGWWPSSKSCWSCDSQMWKEWGSGYSNGAAWTGPMKETFDPNEAWYCGYWTNTGGTTYKCSGRYVGGKCVNVVDGYTAKTCSEAGGSNFRANRVSYSGLGTCQFAGSVTSTTNSSWHFTDGNWSQGITYWEYYKMDAYSYKSKTECPSSHPTKDGSGCYKNITPYCSSGTMSSNGNCIVCPSGYTLNKGTEKCEQSTNKVCLAPFTDGEENGKCYKNRHEDNYCKNGSFNATNRTISYSGNAGYEYVSKTNRCVKCPSGFLSSEGLCKIAIQVNLPNTVSPNGAPPCYKTTTKVNTWSCPANYTRQGTSCVNTCNQSTLVTGILSELNNSDRFGASLKGGTNKQIDENLVANTTVSSPIISGATVTFNTMTNFKINESTNRYFNKQTGDVANSASGWNSKYVFDRQEGVVSLSINDKVTENGQVKKYDLEINNSKFGLIDNYGKYIVTDGVPNKYVCKYKTTINSCKCPYGTFFEGISLYDLTGNICNLEDNNNTCAELQYKYCKKPEKYFCKNSSSGLVDISACVNQKIHNGTKPYSAFLECRNENSNCTQTCNLTCKGNCVESSELTGNVILNTTKCDGKYCNISPYCKLDNAIVSSSSLECIAVNLNLRSGKQVIDALNNNSISLATVKTAAKTCESTICGKQKIIFRSVDLSNPFYGNGIRDFSGFSLTGNKSRSPGSNWNSTDVVREDILKGRDKEGLKLYTKKPLYEITLTSQNIKDLREYNKTHSYAEFDLNCNDANKTYGCISNFVHGDSNSLKGMNINVTGVASCTSINLSTTSENYEKCYYEKN